MSLGDKQLPEPPDKPLPEDCCGNGCSPCVLDVYEKLFQQWKDHCRRIKEDGITAGVANNTVAVLSMTRYMPFQLVSVNRMTCDTNVYRFQAVILNSGTEGNILVKGNKADIRIHRGSLCCLPGQHFFLRGRVKTDSGELESTSSDKSVVTRAYTPISDGTDHAIGIFDVIIKIYKHGKMSAFVRQLQEGDVTFWRGPYGSFCYKRNSFKSVLMLCAGTGIAPLYSIAKQIVNDDQDDTMVRMLFVCKSMESILLRNEIHKLRSFWNFGADIFLSCDSSGSPRYGETIKEGRLERDQVRYELNKVGCENCLVLICGPPSFNETMAVNVQECSVPKEHVCVF